MPDLVERLKKWPTPLHAEAAARIEELEAALHDCLDQAVGCWLNHYPGDDISSSPVPEHIAQARAALSPPPVKVFLPDQSRRDQIMAEPLIGQRLF